MTDFQFSHFLVFTEFLLNNINIWYNKVCVISKLPLLPSGIPGKFSPGQYTVTGFARGLFQSLLWTPNLTVIVDTVVFQA